MELFSADGRKLTVRGCLPVIIFTGKYDNQKSTREVLYFVDGFKNTILSRGALKKLGSVSQNFPEIASVSMVVSRSKDENVTKRNYSDVVKSNLRDKAQIDVKNVAKDRKTDKLHLQQKVASASRSSIMLINEGGREINSSVDVVTDGIIAPHLRQSTGSTSVASATYWRPWD